MSYVIGYNLHMPREHVSSVPIDIIANLISATILEKVPGNLAKRMAIRRYAALGFLPDVERLIPSANYSDKEADLRRAESHDGLADLLPRISDTPDRRRELLRRFKDDKEIQASLMDPNGGLNSLIQTHREIARDIRFRYE